ncbi:hypothetical protein [Mesorhizobium sp. B2-3-10]|uniref:hypothetical protein n=1 Tax=Mesorhizobium sp. B2-3-10 TaxID=2589954 RepID=UPI001129D24E|nr:hypothetical protein [Mesorhizobium sp. B2-3-10]TPL96054.1 hypothetical protein FJ943_23125 [Mesorhizobium sp. B2-3-10]
MFRFLWVADRKIAPLAEKTRKGRALFLGAMRFFLEGLKLQEAALRKAAQTQFRNKIQQFGKTGEKIGWHKHPSTAGNLAAAQAHGHRRTELGTAMQRGSNGSMGAPPGMSLAAGSAQAMRALAPYAHAPETVKTGRSIP